MMTNIFRAAGAVAWLLVVSCAAALGAEGVVRPLEGNPGNIFLEGQTVRVALPGGAWRLVDERGKVIREGEGGAKDLGTLAAGYYEIRRTDGTRVATLGVLKPLAAATPKDSPIGLDVAGSWFYSNEQRAAVANLCALAGVNWVRDRLAWGEAEPRRGEWAASTRYDRSAAAQSAAGLRVLQVNHSSPGWANRDGKRFPEDLRDVHRSYRQFAERWKGKVAAFEPWNEADIEVFGGHTGAEMASLQKAAWLGLKAGNPEIIACLNVFAMNRRAQQEDLDANEAWAYFDTCNLHHYIALDQYPAWYASFRAISAGRPLWVTEFSMPLQWSGDAGAQELSDADRLRQAQRVPMVFAASLHEGTEAAFFFLLPHYVEGKTQFGILQKDLTPRPAYVALATVGRLLAGAKSVGRLRHDSTAVRGYVFEARPDGEAREVLVAWSSSGTQEVRLGARPVMAYDFLGRGIVAEETLKVGVDPVYAVMERGTSRRLAVEPAPARPVRREGKASPIVLQAVWSKDRVALSRSAYRVSSLAPQRIPVFAYNFSGEAAKGKLAAEAPKGWTAKIAEPVELGPGERKELALEVTSTGPAAGATSAVRVKGDFGTLGGVVLSIRLQGEPAKTPPAATKPIEQARKAAAWKKEVSEGSTARLTEAGDGEVLVETALGGGDRWVFPRIDLAAPERPGPDARELHFDLTPLEGNAHYRIIFVEENGASYVGEPVIRPENGKKALATVILEEAVLGAGWSPADPNHRLDADQIRSIKIGCNAKSERVRYQLGNLRWVHW